MSENGRVEILEIHRAEVDTEALWGFAIDQPKQRSKTNTYTIYVAGWILGKQSKVIEVELLDSGRPLRKAIVGRSRPDVAKQYPQVSEAANSGFQIEVGVIGLPLEGELSIQAIFENQSSVAVGVIKYRRQRLHSNYKSRVQPLLMTSSGRSGSTWIMRLLSHHPKIVTSQIHPYEIRVSQYWMQMLAILSQPHNPVDFPPDYFYNEFRCTGQNPYHNYNISHCLDSSWLGREYIENLADFCRQNIDNFYEDIATQQGKALTQTSDSSSNCYFVEKFLLKLNRTVLLELYPQAREIILVRDFRDMACSITAFNTKRGYVDFGRQRFKSDREYIQKGVRSAAHNILQLWKQRKEQAHLVRYEDLILAPQETLSSIFEYLNLDNSSSTISKILEKASEDTPQLKRHRTSANPQESIGRWRHDLEPSLQDLCTEVCKEALQEFGYSLSGEEKPSPLPKTIKPQIETEASLTPTRSNVMNQTESARKYLKQIKSQLQNIKNSLEQC
ncbi:sulfotransferase domain protein [Lyngbya aestuarii BL J]|uniref:Sulfotransferase domain protein n=1 Tax=Lyngbya aestuarii BL J TaxID=1348334 RepID=U7QJQ6_9CYAN|nr:sulfotransferase [Lyngbya aestuarii]ERT08199.1 sulfotransferase domain protein [Lyngbya aestuarii BL J]